MKKEIEKTRKDVEPDFLSTYDRVSKSSPVHPTWLRLRIKNVPVATCVSNDVVSSVLVEKKLPNVISAVELYMWRDDSGNP